MAAETESVVLTLVGRMGAPPTTTEVLESRHRLDVPQIWPVGQQPPPSEAGQDWKPEVHVKLPCEGVVVVVALLLGAVVGSGAMTVVADVTVVMPPLTLCVTVTVVV